VKIAIGSDHAGYELKQYLQTVFASEHEFVDVGTRGTESVDYPDFAQAVARLVTGSQADFGILICGTGVGMSVAANKVPGVRASLVFDLYTGMQSRRHVDANILVLGALVTGKGLAVEIVKAWLETPFEGGRHEKRIAKIRRLEHDFHGSAQD
jgi:ribose 5-phosphate isomerase B